MDFGTELRLEDSSIQLHGARCQECARKASQYTQPCSIVEDPHPAEGVKDFGTMSKHTVSQQHAEA